MAADASSDPLLRGASASVVGQLGAGQTLAVSLRDQLLVPDFLAWMAGMGERSDRLGETLLALAAYERALTVFRALGSRFDEALMLNNVGLELVNQGPVTILLDSKNLF